MKTRARVAVHVVLLVAAAAQPTTTFVVRSDGSGQYSSLQAAVTAAAANPVATGHAVFDVRGTFFERVHVPATLRDGVTIVGTGTAPLDALLVHNTSGAAVGTFSSWTLMVDSLNVTLVNVAVANNESNYDRKVAGQSVALHLNGGAAGQPQRVRDVNSSLLGAQDTLYTGGAFSQSFFSRTYINGTCGVWRAGRRRVLRRHHLLLPVRVHHPPTRPPARPPVAQTRFSATHRPSLKTARWSTRTR